MTPELQADVIEGLIILYGTQLLGLVMVLIIAGLCDDDDMRMKKKTLIVWAIPFVMPIFVLIKGFVLGLSKLK